MQGEGSPDTTTPTSPLPPEGQDTSARRGAGAAPRIAALLVALSSTLLSLSVTLETFLNQRTSWGFWDPPYAFPLLLVFFTLLPIAAFTLIALKQHRMRQLEDAFSRSIDDFDDSLMRIAIQAVADEREVRRRLTDPETQ